MSRAVCIIPARMGSSRFPGKPLAPLLGMPLVLHVWHRCRLCTGFERILIATCDEEIRIAVEDAGGEAVMTADTHERATDRTQEAMAKCDLGLADDDLVIMVQGDEVLVAPEMTDAILSAYENSKAPALNLASRLARSEDIDDPNVVKVVAAPDGRALYLSRAPIPSRARGPDAAHYQQTGIMGFSVAFLHRFGTLAQTPLEIAESVDMLRVLEHGLTLQLVYTESETIGVDTPADLARAEKILATDPLTARYMEKVA